MNRIQVHPARIEAEESNMFPKYFVTLLEVGHDHYTPTEL